MRNNRFNFAVCPKSYHGLISLLPWELTASVADLETAAVNSPQILRPAYQVGMLGSVARLPRVAAVTTGMAARSRCERRDINKDGCLKRGLDRVRYPV